ncbi:MAG: Protein-glutamine gamma-glutamyltransferase [Anaerolineales bacterium]|nr:Protein-glutamine gamma-glutamyltransferase [Anaerolineales bacterium]
MMIVTRLLRALSPRIGWPMFVAVLTVGISFPSAVYAGHWVRDSGQLVLLGVAGGIIGTWVAGRSWRDRVLWTVGFVAGGLAAFALIGQTLPPLGLLAQAADVIETRTMRPDLVGDVLRATEWLGSIVWIYGHELVLRTQAFGAQITRWIQIALSGGTSRDNDIFLLWTGWLSWSLAFHTAAAFTRQRHPSLALAPVGLAATAVVATGRGGAGWLYIFLVVGTGLWAHGVYARREHRWIREGVDYSAEINLDVVVAGVAVSALAVTTAAVMATGIPWAGNVLREAFREPSQDVATTLDRLFAGVRRPPAGGSAWGRADFSDLPLTKVLAGPPELRDDPVLHVTVESAAATGAPQLYWRGLTYDTYTGRGWTNSTRETEQRPPRPIQVAHLGPEITQHIKLLAESDRMRYAAAQPVRVDVDATWVTRDGGDLIGWYADAREYTVVSQPTMASVEALRNTPSEYPAWVIERYLQLPAGLPARARERAQTIAGDAETAYDKAKAIEAEMRAITYSLGVNAPPPDRDVVDYFLFEMDAGYCDYFATTMTVLARAVGVPARLATGYATGAYDPELGFYVVTGLDAHAWVEVYFAGIGWVPFEPTPAREVPERAPAPPSVAGDDSYTPANESVTARLRQVPWPAIGLLLVVILGAVGLILWALRHDQAGKRTPEDLIRDAYSAVWREAGWFGWDGNVSQTPWEAVTALQNALTERSLEVNLGGRQWSWRGADVVADLGRLGDLFIKAQYGRQGISIREVQAARGAWQRIRWRLVLLWRDSCE